VATVGPFGKAWDVSGDIHPSFRTITSQSAGDLAAQRILQNAIVRILDTPPGSLPDAPDRGYSLNRLLLLEMSLDDIDAEAATMQEQIQLDERIISADVTIERTMTATGVELLIKIQVEPDYDGPFEFTISASEAGLVIV
jgi:phage baseplate assembly protein W